LNTNKHEFVNDIYGKALLDYYRNPKSQELIVHSDIAETEPYPISWFFREENEFPQLEKVALEMCRGKILDVGAGTGIHSKHLQNKGLDVYAIDISPAAVQIMKESGIRIANKLDFFTLKSEKFDTLLLLMNGFGIMGKLENVPDFFSHVDQILAPDGQIIVDSSDLIHLYAEDDGSVMIDLNGPYYGEITYQMEFNGEFGHPFPWLFIDFGLLQEYADNAGFTAELIYEEDANHYLALLKRK
jgi:SAM-dependent methyltransferase